MVGIGLTSVFRDSGNMKVPQIHIVAGWLTDMGFVQDALVQFLPEPDGATFTLYNENIQKYSELHRDTKEKNGKLIKVSKHGNMVQITICGGSLNKAGFIYGDKLILRYGYGLIRVRKLPYIAVKLVTARVVGKWLNECGFVFDAVLTVESVHGLITCTLQENGVERTAELVKYARENTLKLLQVKRLNHSKDAVQWIDIPHTCFDRAGFKHDETLLAFYEYGTIKLQKPDFNALGF